jgi:putative ABC transport system permease protein
VSVLAIKRRRDLWRLKGQVATISLVLACGVMSIIMLRGTYGALLRAREDYYQAQHFADAFARVERAPEALAARLERVPGVARAHTRVVIDVMVPLAGENDPVTGRVVSLPDDGLAPLNRLILRSGRLPAPGVADEAVILEQFAEARHLGAGDTLPAVMNGSLRRLHIVGVAISPEYLFAMSGRQGGIADDRRFVVVWMLRSTMAPLFRMEGAFNDVTFALQPGAPTQAVLAGIDHELARYGGFHAVARAKQLSHEMLSGELEQLSNLALMIPTVFLLVAAFLVNVVISRLVYLERTQIAILKALGRRRGEIGLHYLGLVATICVLGSLLGLLLGFWSGTWMTNLYRGFFRFPAAELRLSPGLLAGSLGVTLVAAVSGALAAVARIMRLPAAEAMRPPTPPSYRRASRRVGALLGPSATMITREIARRPLRFLLSTAAISLGVGIFIMGRFTWDAFDRLLNEDLVRADQADLQVIFARPLSSRAVRELEHVPGVLHAEGNRAVGVRFRARGAWRDGAIVAPPYPGQLRRLYRQREHLVDLPAEGLVMTDKLAEILGVGVGDHVEVDILEGDFATRSALVAGTIDEAFGLQAYARPSWLAGFLREQPRVTSVYLRVDPARLAEVRARAKDFPQVIGTSSVGDIIRHNREQTGKTIGWITVILTLSAAAISMGVVYNNARIALSMRSRDLASLRVLGLTRQEISAILLGELGAQVALGIPLGLLVGNGLGRLSAAGFDPERIRLPFYVAPTTYATAVLIAFAACVASALLVRRRLDRLDLIAVLKATE